MKKWKWTVLSFLTGLPAFPCQAQEISPLLVGNNLWYKDPSATVWNLTKDCGVQFIRIGGASYDKTMPSTTTLLGWVNKIQQIGAEPMIQVSQYQTAVQAAALVKYFNAENHGNSRPVKYWCIGNEPWLQAGRPATSTFGAVIEGYFKPIAQAMKEVDSTILIFGPDCCDYIDDIYNDLFGGENDITGKIPGKSYYYCDGLSWHRYPQGSGDPATEGADDMLTRVKKAKTKVDFVNTLHNRTGGEALQWGIGEYNSKGGPEVHSWGNGQMFGSVLGGCMKYGATYAASWSMFESGGDRTSTDFSFIDGNMIPRASYRHMQVVAKYFHGNYVDGKSTNTNLRIFAAREADTLSVMIMNTATATHLPYTLFLSYDSTLSSGVQLNVNDSSSIRYNDLIQARSTQVIVFRGNEILRWTYTSQDFDLERAPSETIIKPADNIPDKPEGLQADTITFKSVTLRWNISSDTISGIVIERKTAASTVFKITGVVYNADTTYTDPGLAAETTYHYRLACYNPAGQSVYSDTLTVTTGSIPAHIPFSGPHKIPGRTQAEDYDDNEEGVSYHDSDQANKGANYRLNQGVDVEKCTDAGAGYNVAYITNGEWLEYTMDTVTAGIYNFTLRTSSNVTSTKKAKLYLGGKLLGSLVPVNTGGWQKWVNLSLTNITLTEGRNQVLRLLFEGQDFNINWFEFVPVPNAVNPSVSSGEMKAWYHAGNRQVYLEMPGTFKQVNIDIIDLSGRLHGSYSRTDFSSGCIDISALQNGLYVLNVLADNRKWSEKLAVY
ncbi:MAG: carbohydrate-binding protein [Bacteroidales bacterium]